MQINRRDLLGLVPAVMALSTAAELRADAGTAKSRIKVGQIGVGHGHASKLSVYRESPDYEVVGIVEANDELRKRAQNNRAYQGLECLTRDQLLKTPGLQAVLVETHVRDLLDNAEACVRAGMHVHIDKPAGESMAQLRRIHEHAAFEGLLVQMGYMYRYNPAFVLLKDFLCQGWLGDIFEVHAVMSKVVDRAGRKELAGYSGGIMFELGCHLIDLVIDILGKPQTVTGYPRQSGAVGDGLLDNMLAVLEYPQAIATIKSSALEVEGFDRRHLVVCGTEGTFHIQPLDDPKARVSLSRARGEYSKGTQEIEFPKYTRYVDDAADMAKIIRREKVSNFNSMHDLTVQETVLRASGYPEHMIAL